VVLKGVHEVVSDILFLSEVTLNSEQSRNKLKRTKSHDPPNHEPQTLIN